MPAKTLLFLAFLISALPACRKPTVPPPAKPAVRNEAPVAAPAAPHFDRLTRSEFNRLAAETFLPLFWVDDSDHDAAVDANELVVSTHERPLIRGYGDIQTEVSLKHVHLHL